MFAVEISDRKLNKALITSLCMKKLNCLLIVVKNEII